MVTSAFRRSTQSENKNKGGGGRRGSYHDRLHIPKEADGRASIVLIRGEYVDPNPPQELIERDAAGNAKPVINAFFKLKKHKRKILNNGREEYRDEPCSRGPDPHNPQPCAGCMAMDRGDKSVTLSDAYLFTVLHMALYHSHPLLDKEKRTIVMKKDNSGPFMVASECDGRLCNFCRVARGEAPLPPQAGQDPWMGWQANQFTTSFGSRRFLEVGKSHLDNLGAFESIISSKCFNPQCGQQLVTDGFTCPTCSNMVIDMATDPRPDDEINKAVQNPYPCMTCRTSVLLQEKVSCEFCEAANRQFSQLSLFDCVVTLFKSGENTKSQIQMQNYASFEMMGAHLAQQGLLQGKTIQQLISDIKPYDFAEMFKPRSLEDQAKRLSLPTNAAPPPSAYAAYGQPNYGQPAPGQPAPQSFYPPQSQIVSPSGYALPPPQQQQAMPGAVPPGFQQPGFPAPATAPVYPQQVVQPQTGFVHPQYAQPTAPQTQGPQPFVPPAPPFFGGH